MRISHYQLRILIESVILEGFQSDQRYLAEKYPESAQDIFRLQPKWISWLMARFGDSPTQKEIHPFSDAIVTVLNFSKKDAAIGEKWKSNEQFRVAINNHFPEGERSWRSPADVMTMTVDQMELILGLAERKKQRIELKDDVASVEGDRVGKVGPWNIWLPTTRENSCKIAGYDPVTMEPKTTWCTARTSGSNLFYNYIGQSGQETTLFYIIKDNPIEDEDWLSLGFVNGKPELNGTDGGLTVDRANKGLTTERLQPILGQHYNKIINMMDAKNKSLGGKHPAREKIIAASQSVEALQYLLNGLSKVEAKEIKKLVIHEPNVHYDIFKLLSKDSNAEIREFIASDKRISQDIIRELAEDSNLNIRCSVAYNENTPSDIFSKLAEDDKNEVRSAVANSRIVSSDILRKLAKDHNWHVRLCVAENRRMPIDIIDKLSKDSHADVRSAVAKNSNSQDILRKLAVDHVAYVRSSAARNVSISPDILRKLAEDPENNVKESVAENEQTPIDVINKLSKDSNVNIRSAVANNRNTPLDILRKFSEDSNANIRSAVANNRNTPSDILRKLSTDLQYNIRSRVAKNINTPPDALDSLANDSEHQVRYSITQNPSVQKETLIKLKNDAIEYIRSLAEERLQALGENNEN